MIFICFAGCWRPIRCTVGEILLPLLPVEHFAKWARRTNRMNKMVCTSSLSLCLVRLGCLLVVWHEETHCEAISLWFQVLCGVRGRTGHRALQLAALVLNNECAFARPAPTALATTQRHRRVQCLFVSTTLVIGQTYKFSSIIVHTRRGWGGGGGCSLAHDCTLTSGYCTQCEVDVIWTQKICYQS